ncbi:MAG: HNH endonuclease domain-containing protein [Sphaerochaeta sp.]
MNSGEHLPFSASVSIPSFLRIFDHTTNSYKFLFLSSLLDRIEQTFFDQIQFSIEEVVLGMLQRAWYPHTFFKLSFGKSDQIANTLTRFSVSKAEDVHCIDTRELARYVPYRLLTPFFSRELLRIPDSKKNGAIVQLAEASFGTKNPALYCFSGDSMILNHHWLVYIRENIALIRAFVNWNFLLYLQKQNPSTPNLQAKLSPPLERQTLTAQSRYYRHVLTTTRLICPYTQKPIDAKRFALDHFLPWSFVAHDQLWNLLPVDPQINSSKSNKLPELDHHLLPFIDLQLTALRSYKANPGKETFKNIAEGYILDLKLSEEELLQESSFTIKMKDTIKPLWALAVHQGFEIGI